MLNWAYNFVIGQAGALASFSSIFAFCDLIVTTFLSMAFSGLLRLRINVRGKDR